jgi:DNA gyrase/topoisomerase IV subunit B
MSSADLAETVTNPTTRRLTQVTMVNPEQAKRAVKIFMTDADIKFKRLFYAGEVDFA